MRSFNRRKITWSWQVIYNTIKNSFDNYTAAITAIYRKKFASDCSFANRAYKFGLRNFSILKVSLHKFVIVFDSFFNEFSPILRNFLFHSGRDLFFFLFLIVKIGVRICL